MDNFISIVIPCRNEKKYIGATIASLLASDYPPGRFEVLVCDGMSEDGTVQIIKQFELTYPQQVRYIENTKRTTPFALNTGIKAAKGDIVIILGAHSEVHPLYLRFCNDKLEEDKSVGCVGVLLDNYFEDEKSESIALAMSSPFGVGGAHFRTGAREGYVDTVAFGAYRREVFEKTGLFDEELVRNQDDEFNYRVIKAGYRIFLSNKIKTKYYVRASFRKLFRQYYQYGYWKVFVNVKHKVVTTMRQLVPPLFVAFLVLGIIACILFPVLWYLFLPALGLYIVGSVIAAAAKAKNITAFFRILISFYILHISYGAGYLEGLFNFVLLGRRPHTKHTIMSR
jgi:glycosyltransferase involved in cell wall biosynthesis